MDKKKEIGGVTRRRWHPEQEMSLINVKLNAEKFLGKTKSGESK